MDPTPTSTRPADRSTTLNYAMDSFINLAKQGYESYSESQHGSNTNVNKTGGQEYNSPHHSQQDQGNYGPNFDHDEVIQTAQQHGGDPSLVSKAMGFLNQNKGEHEQPIDEEHVQSAHRAAYQDDSARNLSAGSMGSAAAMQVLQKFTSGGSGGGGGSKSELISMAMAEASKLFDKSGGAASGNKQDAVNGAGMTIMKLMVQSKFSGATGGGNSGGLGSLMGMASKFI